MSKLTDSWRLTFLVLPPFFFLEIGFENNFSQREVIYRERRRILEKADLRSGMLDMLREHLDLILEAQIDPDSPSDLWEAEQLPEVLRNLSMDVPMMAEVKIEELKNLGYDDLKDKLWENLELAYKVREEHLGEQDMREFERQVLLHNIDSKWVDYLHNIDLLREGIQLRAYGQRDPLQEYKREAFNMFNQLLRSIQADSIQQIFRAQPQMEMNLPDEFDGITFENLPEGMTEEDMMKIIEQIQAIQAGMGNADGFLPIEGLEGIEGVQLVQRQPQGEPGDAGQPPLADAEPHNGNGSAGHGVDSGAKAEAEAKSKAEAGAVLAEKQESDSAKES